MAEGKTTFSSIASLSFIENLMNREAAKRLCWTSGKNLFLLISGIGDSSGQNRSTGIGWKNGDGYGI
jgi:hypothetical protein